MWPDRVSNPGPLTYESGALPTALRGPAFKDLIPYTMKKGDRNESDKVASLIVFLFTLILVSMKVNILGVAHE